MATRQISQQTLSGLQCSATVGVAAGQLGRQVRGGATLVVVLDLRRHVPMTAFQQAQHLADWCVSLTEWPVVDLVGGDVGTQRTAALAIFEVDIRDARPMPLQKRYAVEAGGREIADIETDSAWAAEARFRALRLSAVGSAAWPHAGAATPRYSALEVARPGQPPATGRSVRRPEPRHDWTSTRLP